MFQNLESHFVGRSIEVRCIMLCLCDWQLVTDLDNSCHPIAACASPPLDGACKILSAGCLNWLCFSAQIISLGLNVLAV